MVRFLHCADLHLDSPLRGLDRYDSAPADEIRQATRRAWKNIVRLAIEQRVDAVILAGDLYDGDWTDYNTGLFFLKEAAKLIEAAVPLVMIAGNHDAANKMTRALALPKGIRMLTHDQPETVLLESRGLAIHGQSFANAKVEHELHADYPPAVPGLFNIGVLHTSADGRDGHARYAPCTVAGLRAKGYDYWALGHVHQREQLCDDPPIHFPGNTQGRHARETGAKGCLLVDVTGGRAVARFHPVDVFRWRTCQVDVTDVTRTDDLLETARNALAVLQDEEAGLPLAVRVEFLGVCPLHDTLLEDARHWETEVRALAGQLGGGLWIEKVKWRVEPPRAAAASDAGPLQLLMELIDEHAADAVRLRGLAGELAELRGKLPDDIARDGEGLDLTDEHWLRGVLAEVRPLLRSRLTRGGR